MGERRDISTEVLGFVNDRLFIDLWQLTSERFPSWDEFASLPMPTGAKPDTVWAVISSLRRSAGRSVPYSHGQKLWYNLPRETQRKAWDVLSRVGPASVLGKYFEEHDYSLVDIESQVGELLTTMRLDGVTTDYESVREILVHERIPRTNSERVMLNYATCLANELAGPRNPPTAADLYKDLAANAEPSNGLNKSDVKALSADMGKATRSNTADTLCFSAHFFEIPAYHRPFEKWNATFGSLLRKVFFIRSGLVTLSLLPLTKEMRAWGDPEGVAFSRIPTQCRDLESQSVDLTPYFAVYLSKIAEGVDTLERLVSEREQREEDIRLAVRSARTLNHRQRDILLAGLDDPNMETSYLGHQETYQVAYATARSDLMGLTRAGYLQSELHGKRELTFKVPLDLRKRLEHHLLPA